MLSCETISVVDLQSQGFVRHIKTVQGLKQDIVIGYEWVKGHTVYHQFPTSNEAILERRELITC